MSRHGMYPQPRPAKNVFLWLPRRDFATGKRLWLQTVRREWWYQKAYFANPNLTSIFKDKEVK